MDEKKQQPAGNSKPLELQLITGTGRVLWRRSLPWSSPPTALDVSVSWNDGRQRRYYKDVDALVTDTSPDSFS